MEEITLRESHTIFTANHHIALKFLGTKLLFQGGTKSYFKVGQIRQLFSSKWGRDSYFKVAHCLCQSGAKFISKWAVTSKGAKCFFKVGQLFQSGRIISQRSITLQSYDLEKSKT